MNTYKCLRALVIFLIIAGWLFSDWPQIWQKPAIPPKIQEARAITCGFGAEIGTTGVCRGFLDGTDGSNQTWNVPSDWTDTNAIECIGAGGGGATAATTGSGGGGGGGAYAKSINLTGITPGGSVTYRLGSGGSANTAGGDTWFNNTEFPSSGQACGAKGGSGGTSGSVTGASGGLAVNSYAIGTGWVKYSGGIGGDGAGVSGNRAGGGGGGAAGLNGAGDYTSAQTTSTGGSGDAGFGGAGGTTGVNGSPGTEYDATHGSGGGGGGGVSGGANPGQTGGLYGAAGGGGGKSTPAFGAGGSGVKGLVVITYTPPPPPEASITITSTPAVAYGIVVLNTTKNTIPTYTQTAENNGTVTEDFYIKSTDATRGGGTTWTLTTTKGANEYNHTASIDGGNTWNIVMNPAGNYTFLKTGVGVGAANAVNFDLQIGMPTGTDDCLEHIITVTVCATIP